MHSVTFLQDQQVHSVEAFRHAHDVNLLILKKRHRMHWVKFGISGAEGRRRLKQNIRGKVLVRNNDRAQPRDPQRAQRELVQEITPSNLLVPSNPVLCFGDKRTLWVAHAWRTTLSI